MKHDVWHIMNTTQIFNQICQDKSNRGSQEKENNKLCTYILMFCIIFKDNKPSNHCTIYTYLLTTVTKTIKNQKNTINIVYINI